MEHLRKNLRALLEFTPSQRRAMGLILVTVVLIHIIRWRWQEHQHQADLNFVIQYLGEDSSAIAKEKYESKPLYRFAPFDPNSIKLQDMVSFGIPEFLAKRIVRYREAGGMFRTKTDFRKIFGMTDEIYEKAEPYLDLPEVVSTAERGYQKNEPRISFQILDLNRADSMELMSIKGIGPVLSRRIIGYRKALGYYSNKEQLKEVYGISDSLYLKIESRFSEPNVIDSLRLNVNTLPYNELRAHPYFRKGQLARLIVNYREHHGPYEALADLRKIHLVNDSIFKRIENYICLDGPQQALNN